MKASPLKTSPAQVVYLGKKFAVLSHILPPRPSGQSILLFRLLQRLPSESYCLISSAVDAPTIEGRLPAEHFHLTPPPRIRKIGFLAETRFFLWINSLWGIRDRARQVANVIERAGCDLIVGCTGDLFDLPAAWLAAKKTGRPFVAYIMDDYVNQWTGLRREIAAFFERRIVRDASRVFVLNEFVLRLYRERYGIEADVIHNPIQLPDLASLDRSAPVLDGGTFNIVYAGSVYQAQADAFVNFIRALESLGRPSVKLHIFSSQTREEMEAQGVTGSCVEFHPHVPSAEVLVALRQADMLFLPLAFKSKIQEVIRTSAPFKTSEYLAVARPIFVHAPNDSFLSWYFKKHECGLVVDDDSAEAVAEVLRGAIDSPDRLRQLSENARERAERDFDQTRMGSKFIVLLNEALNREHGA